MIDKNLGIVAIATLVAGAGFLLKGEKTSNKSAEGKEFMAQGGRAIDKRKIKFGIFDPMHGEQRQDNLEFSKPIREEMVKKLSRRGLIPDFVASPGYPSYREWLGTNFEKGTTLFQPPRLNQYKNGYQFDLTVRGQELPPKYDSNGNPLPYNEYQVYIGNMVANKGAVGTTYWKYPFINWKFIAKQKAQYPIDMAAGVYGKMYQSNIARQPLSPDMRGTPFGNLNWGKSIALKHWMELNPQVKFVTYKTGKYGNRHTIRYLKDLPSSFNHYGRLTNENGGAIENRKTMYLRIPDKSVVDKQANEAFDYFVTLWKEYLNAQMIERYSQEIVADYQKGVQEQAMWANLKSSGKLKEYLMEQFDNKRGRMLNPPPAYIPETKAVWEEWKEAQLKGVIDRHNASMSNFEHFMSWF